MCDREIVPDVVVLFVFGINPIFAAAAANALLQTLMVGSC